MTGRVPARSAPTASGRGCHASVGGAGAGRTPAVRRRSHPRSVVGGSRSPNSAPKIEQHGHRHDTGATRRARCPTPDRQRRRDVLHRVVPLQVVAEQDPVSPGCRHRRPRAERSPQWSGPGMPAPHGSARGSRATSTNTRSRPASPATSPSCAAPCVVALRSNGLQPVVLEADPGTVRSPVSGREAALSTGSSSSGGRGTVSGGWRR